MNKYLPLNKSELFKSNIFSQLKIPVIQIKQYQVFTFTFWNISYFYHPLFITKNDNYLVTLFKTCYPLMKINSGFF